MNRYSIAQTASRTGFSTSALRYYDELGLVRPVDRTEAGYRVYDDNAIRRLELIARVKRLGLSLDDARELVDRWEGGECSDVQTRLRDLVVGKLAATQRTIAEGMATAADLQAVAAHLASRPRAGGCDDECPCMTEPAPTVTRGIQITPKRVPDDPDLVCTLTPGAMPGRMADWQHVLERAEHRSAIAGGVRIVFAPDPELAAELSRLAVLEHDCCTFFTFAIRVTGGRLELDVEAPDAATELIDTVFGLAPEAVV